MIFGGCASFSENSVMILRMQRSNAALVMGGQLLWLKYSDTRYPFQAMAAGSNAFEGYNLSADKIMQVG